jgi:CMP-N,N'-diacetyllegionaminic acid synthase
MNILGVIPARKGSKGIKSKNTKLLNGKPLVSYTIEQALMSNINELVVSTDCINVKLISKKYGLKVIDRPNELARDNSPTLPVLQHAISQFSDSYDAVMTLQPTSPLRTHEHINESIDLFIKDPIADSLVSVTKAPHNCTPEKIMQMNGNYLSGNNFLRRRQDIGEYFVRNGAAIYISKVAILSQNIIGDNILPYLMSKIDSFDIDDIEDWKIVEAILMSTSK